MVYYHIELSTGSKKICTVVLLWGKYEHHKVPMVFCNSPDICHEKIYDILEVFDTLRVYIDNPLLPQKIFCIISQGTRESPTENLESVNKVNAENSIFGCTENEYLGLWVSKDGVILLESKV